jgi:hypothetical protein
MEWWNRGSGDRGTQGKTLTWKFRPMRNVNEEWTYRSLSAIVAQSKIVHFELLLPLK